MRGNNCGGACSCLSCRRLLFAGHYYWRTQIDGTDYSFRSKEQVREEILNPSVAYELQIYGREDMQDIVKPDQVGMTYVYDNTLDRINAQLTGLKWPMMFFGGRDFELPKAVTYSDDALAERLSETVFLRRPISTLRRMRT